MRKVGFGKSFWILGLSVAALGACAKQGAAPTAPAAPAAPADKADAEGAAPAPTADPCHGRMASMTEWFGMGYHRRVLGCTDGAFTVEVDWVESHGDSDDPQRVEIDPETWEAAWDSLEDAGWRTMATDCPKGDDPGSWENTGVDFEITDGKATVEFSCNGQPNETHLAVYEILDEAGAAVGDEEPDGDEEESGEAEEGED